MAFTLLVRRGRIIHSYLFLPTFSFNHKTVKKIKKKEALSVFKAVMLLILKEIVNF